MKIINHFGGGKYMKIARNTVMLLLVVFFVWVMLVDYYRVKSESKNNSVEICIDFDEACSLCALNNYPIGDFLERSKAIGITSAALQEESPATLSSSGKIVYFSAAEYSRAKLLDIATQGGMVANNMIASEDEAVVKNISGVLVSRYNIKVKNQKAGKYFIAYPIVDQTFPPGYLNDTMPVGFSTDKQKLLVSKGLECVYRIQNIGYPKWLQGISTTNISGVMWDSLEIPGYQGRESELSSLLKESHIKFVGLEFVNIAGQEYLEKTVPGLMVRGHSIAEAELGHSQNPEFWVSRWSRAVKERNIRFLYLHFWKNKSIEDNLAYARMTAHSIKNAGFELNASAPPPYPIKNGRPIRIMVVLLLCVVIPLAGLKIALVKNNYIYSFFVANMTSLLGGMAISAVLYDAYFMQKMIDMPMVSVAFFLPILLSVFILFKSEKLRGFWNLQLEIKHLIIALAVLCTGTVLYLRSGNGAADWLVPDSGFRQALENLFWIRPRTKEFIIGQPLLLLGFYTRNPWIILAGMIGQVSICNTFMHSHTPFIISIARTLHGMVLGFVVGLVIIKIYKIIKMHLQNCGK